jgi:CheY-like chemotaxis protein
MTTTKVTLTQAQIAAAVATYLRLAFPGDSKPRRRVPDLATLADLSAVLGCFELDVAPLGERDGFSARKVCRRYVMRIGNHAYPHMKFTIEQSSDLVDWFFAVDCHDSAVRCPTPSDEEAWRPILEQNRAIREAIEAAWSAEGLPCRRSSQRDQLRRLSDRKRGLGVPADGPMVLVVDDEEDAAELFAIYLRRAGFRAEVVTDPSLAIAAALRIKPDLILLDYMMEPLSGRELLDQIRSSRILRHTPTIICTYAELSRADLPSADLVLRKPLSREQLVTRIAEFISVPATP